MSEQDKSAALNEQLAAFKKKFDPIVETRTPTQFEDMARVITEFWPHVYSLVIGDELLFAAMQLWLRTRGNNAEARYALESYGIEYPYELAYLHLIGIQEEVATLVKAQAQDGWRSDDPKTNDSL